MCSAAISSGVRGRSHTHAPPSHPVIQPGGSVCSEEVCSVCPEGKVDSGPEGAEVDSCPQLVTMEPQQALCALPTSTGAAMAVPTQKEVLPPWVLPPWVLPPCAVPPWVLPPCAVWPCAAWPCSEDEECEEGAAHGGGAAAAMPSPGVAVVAMPNPGVAVAIMRRQPSLPLMR